jgi:hypothetical protein
VSRRCPGCGRAISPRAIACPTHRPLIPADVRESLARAFVANLWWSDSPLWIRPYEAAVAALRAMREAGTIPAARFRQWPQRRPFGGTL